MLQLNCLLAIEQNHNYTFLAHAPVACRNAIEACSGLACSRTEGWLPVQPALAWLPQHGRTACTGPERRCLTPVPTVPMLQTQTGLAADHCVSRLLMAIHELHCTHHIMREVPRSKHRQGLRQTIVFNL